MKIKFYGYNTFIIRSGDRKIAIDPGATFLYYFRMKTLIPKSEWNDITHILVTHGDPDHYWHMDRVAEASGAPVVCNRTMVKEIEGDQLLLGPRDKGLAFTTAVNNLHTISVGETIDLEEISITGTRATHGPLKIKIGPFSKVIKPGPEERIGWGSMGFKIRMDGMTVVNLGDTLPHFDEWASLNNPDLLMIPIGGRAIHNTMDEREALEAVSLMRPKHVIPCHYNCPAFFTKKYNPADEKQFRQDVENLGISCHLMNNGDEIEV
jgi:L-ascorbate metabolism protein UlaG (beta-lactamase superfamily)